MIIKQLSETDVESLEERNDCSYVSMDIAFVPRNDGHEDLFTEHLGKEFIPLLKKFFRELSDEALRLRMEREIEIENEQAPARA